MRVALINETSQDSQGARRHFIWRRADWNRVLFNDESRFAFSHIDGRTRGYRRTNKVMRIAACWEGIDLVGQLGGFGGIMGGQKTDLVVTQGNLNAHHYIDDASCHAIST